MDMVSSFMYSNPADKDNVWASRLGRASKAVLGGAVTAGMVWYTNQEAIVTLATVGTGLLRNAIMKKYYGKTDDKERVLEKGTFQPAFTGAYLCGSLLLSYSAYKAISVAADTQAAALNFAKSYSGLSLIANGFAVTPFKGQTGEERIGSIPQAVGEWWAKKSKVSKEA